MDLQELEDGVRLLGVKVHAAGGVERGLERGGELSNLHVQVVQVAQAHFVHLARAQQRKRRNRNTSISSNLHINIAGGKNQQDGGTS